MPIVINDFNITINLYTIRPTVVKSNSNNNNINSQGAIIDEWEELEALSSSTLNEYNVELFSIAQCSNTTLLINCKLRRSQSSLHTARRCIPNVPTYISNDHEHQNGTINHWRLEILQSSRSMLQFKAESLMDITCGLMISQDRNLIRLFVTYIGELNRNNIVNPLINLWRFVFSDSNKLTLFITKVFGYRPGNNSSAFNVSTHEGAGTFQALANKELTSPKANWASRL
ncbi:hypothetical protein H8356DRAFT_1327027 [Neocallimastix lanati (nom. inval.)]|nr:hypothetical protein H8356DRAFT_1327027 [Neocallimastix sp. JGI-2020a]